VKEKKTKRLFNEKLSKYEQLLVDFHKEIGKSKRVNEKFIALGTYLLLYNKLTQSDLTELTGFSSGTISTYLSVMEGMGIIDKNRIPKTHTYEYGIKVPINELIIKRYDESLESILSLKTILSKKKEELHELAQRSKAGAEHLSKRIEELLKALDHYETFISILK
jgi:DNA-binding transcriptional regulator GbsR (MarR family)